MLACRVLEMEIYEYNAGHMAAMAVYGKIPLKILFQRTRGTITRELGLKQQGFYPIIVCSSDNHGLTLTYVLARSNLEQAFI